MTFPAAPETSTGLPPDANAGPVGIGGWLILPLIGFIGTMLLTAWNLVQVFMSWDGLVAIFTKSEFAGARAPMAMSFISGALVIASAAYCLYLLFAKKRALINMAAAHYAILAAAGLIDLWGTGALEKAIPGMAPDPTAIRDAIRGVLVAAIWIPYFRVSKRVHNTFTA